VIFHQKAAKKKLKGTPKELDTAREAMKRYRKRLKAAGKPTNGPNHKAAVTRYYERARGIKNEKLYRLLIEKKRVV